MNGETKADSQGRRYFLIASTSAASVAGVIGAAVPFVGAWQPSAKARAAGAPIRLDISRLRPGEVLRPIPAWRGQPVFVVARSAESVTALDGAADELADPDSENLANQPAYSRICAWLRSFGEQPRWVHSPRYTPTSGLRDRQALRA